MKNRKWTTAWTALVIVALLSGCGNETGDDTPVSVPTNVDLQPSEAPGTYADTEEELKTGEYTLWTGTYTLYYKEQVYAFTAEEKEYDASSNLILEGSIGGWDGWRLDAALNGELDIESWTRWEYDENGKVTKGYTYSSRDEIDDDAAISWVEYEYDASGNLIKETPSDAWTVEYEYDASGNLTRRATIFGWSEYEYDTSGKLIRETSGDEDGTHFWTEYEYDASGNLTIELTAANGLTEYEYDTSGNLTKIMSGIGEWIEYEYDESGNSVKVTFSNGTSIECEYAVSDNCPPVISDSISSGIWGSLYAKVMDNPVKITCYDNNDNVYSIWEWTSEIIIK